MKFNVRKDWLSFIALIIFVSCTAIKWNYNYKRVVGVYDYRCLGAIQSNLDEILYLADKNQLTEKDFAEHMGEIKTLVYHVLSFSPNLSEAVWLLDSELIDMASEVSLNTYLEYHLDYMKKLQKELEYLVKDVLSGTGDVGITTYNYFRNEENYLKFLKILDNEKLQQ